MGELIKKDSYAELKNIIYQQLKMLNEKKDTPLYRYINELKQKLADYKKEEKQIENNKNLYHDNKNVFNRKNILSNIYLSYTTFKQKKILDTNETKHVRLLDDIYHLIIKIRNELKQQSINIKYAVYFEKDGKVYRSFQNEIKKAHQKTSYTESALKINAAKFKNAMAYKKNKQGKLINTNQAIDVTDHYNTFYKTIYDTYTGDKQIFKNTLNRGIIAEAFERHLYDTHKNLLYSNEEMQLAGAYDWTVDEAWQYIRLSKGNDAWYTGGDIEDIQVKSLFAGDRQITSFQTIEDLYNFFDNLTKRGILTEKELKEQTEDIFNIFYNKVNDKAEETLKMTAQEIIQEFINMSNKKLTN